MGALVEIAAAHAHVPSTQAKDADRREFERRMREQARLAEARAKAMRKARQITGRVIFPGRWDAEVLPEYDDCVCCVARWEGLTLVVRHFKSRNVSRVDFKVKAPTARRDGTVSVKDSAGLAAALRKWGIA